MRRAAVVVVAACAFVATDVAAQTTPRRDPPGSEAGAQLLSIVGLAITPDITASRLEIDDDSQLAGQRIDTLRLANDVSLATRDGPIYLEGNVGFARAELDLRLGDAVAETNNFDAIGAFGAVGPDFRLGRFTRLRPLLILGVGYVDDAFGLPEPIAGDSEESLDLRQWSVAAGLGLSVDHERPLGDDVIDLRLKLSHVAFDTLWAADRRLATETVNQTVNASAAYKHDTGLRLGAHPLLLTGLLGANAFLGDQQAALGFSWFAEYGAGLEVDLSGGEGAVQRARVRVTGIAGARVTGISFGAGIGF
jgi:hypothetical protein